MSLAKERKEIRDLSPKDIAKQVMETSDEMMKLRFRKSGGQLENTSQLKDMRRKVARLKTILLEKTSTQAE